MTDKEKARLKMIMTKLDLTEEEAKSLLIEDKKIDRMRKFSDIQSDLSKDQIKVSKQARQVAKTNIGMAPKKTPSERVKKVDEDKKVIIDRCYALLQEMGAENLQVVIDNKKLEFNYNGRNFKLDLIASRK